MTVQLVSLAVSVFGRRLPGSEPPEAGAEGRRLELACKVGVLDLHLI